MDEEKKKRKKKEKKQLTVVSVCYPGDVLWGPVLKSSEMFPSPVYLLLLFFQCIMNKFSWCVKYTYQESLPRAMLLECSTNPCSWGSIASHTRAFANTRHVHYRLCR